jgi:hypothetical protein
MKVKFEDYKHWCEFWNGAMPYDEPMESKYLERIKNEFPALVLQKVLWLAYNGGDKILTAKVTSFTPINKSIPLELINLTSNNLLHIDWLAVVDYEIENNQNYN